MASVLLSDPARGSTKSSLHSRSLYRPMRLVVARCSATYSGRIDTVLPEALRLIMVKADGSVLLHADMGGY